MISSIEISSFRGIREGKLDGLTPLTILVGPNGCGKSTVLDAMLIGASPTPGVAVLQTIQRHAGVVERGRWLFWRQENMPWNARITIHAVHAGNQTNRSSVLTLEPHSSSAIALEEIITCASTWHDKPITGDGSRDAPRIYVRLTSQDDSAEKTPIPSLKGVDNIRLSGGDGNQKTLHELFSEAARAGQRENTRALIAKLVPGLKDLEILTEAGDPILYLVFEDGAVPVALSGDGILAAVQTALELASLPNGVALLEEPELHQHPGAMRQTVRAILAAVRRNIQVVLTTHSLEFIDVLLAEAFEEDIERLSLYRLELEKGRLIAVRTPGPDVAFARGDIQEDLR